MTSKLLVVQWECSVKLTTELTCGGAGVSTIPNVVCCNSLVWCSVPDEQGNTSATDDVMTFSVITCIDVFHALL